MPPRPSNPDPDKEIDVEEKNIGIADVDRSSQVFTLFGRLPVQKDTQFKTLNSEILYPV